MMDNSNIKSWTCAVCDIHVFDREDVVLYPAGLAGDKDRPWICGECFEKKPEELVPEDIREQMEHTKLHWCCFVDGCTSITNVKDYGIFPYLHWGRRGWINVSTNFFMCGKHYKLYKKGELLPPESMINPYYCKRIENKLTNGNRNTNRITGN